VLYAYVYAFALCVNICGPCNNQRYLGHGKNVYDDDILTAILDGMAYTSADTHPSWTQPSRAAVHRHQLLKLRRRLTSTSPRDVESRSRAVATATSSYAGQLLPAKSSMPTGAYRWPRLDRQPAAETHNKSTVADF